MLYMRHLHEISFDLFQADHNNSPHIIAAIFIFDVIADIVHSDCLIRVSFNHWF